MGSFDVSNNSIVLVRIASFVFRACRRFGLQFFSKDAVRVGWKTGGAGSGSTELVFAGWVVGGERVTERSAGRTGPENTASRGCAGTPRGAAQRLGGNLGV